MRAIAALALSVFSHADSVGAVDHLSLQVGQRNGVVIDDAERADAGGGEIFEHRRSQAARADDQDPRAFQFLLAGAADFGQHDVAGIAFESLRR